MNVWTLQECDYDTYEPIGIFSSKEKAIEKLFLKYPKAVDITITHKPEGAGVNFSTYVEATKTSIRYAFFITPYLLDMII